MIREIGKELNILEAVLSAHADEAGFQLGIGVDENEDNNICFYFDQHEIIKIVLKNGGFTVNRINAFEVPLDALSKTKDFYGTFTTMLLSATNITLGEEIFKGLKNKGFYLFQNASHEYVFVNNQLFIDRLCAEYTFNKTYYVEGTNLKCEFVEPHILEVCINLERQHELEPVFENPAHVMYVNLDRNYYLIEEMLIASGDSDMDGQAYRPDFVRKALSLNQTMYSIIKRINKTVNGYEI